MTLDPEQKLGLALAAGAFGLAGLLGLLTLRPAPQRALGGPPRRGSAHPLSRRRTRFRGLGESETSCSTTPNADVAIRTCVTRPKKAGPVVDSPEKVCSLLRNASKLDRESFFTISVDPQMRVLGVEETHRGSLDSVEVHPREVMKAAVLLGAKAVIVAHNHPSGDPSPSADDTQLTRSLYKAGETMGIKLLDHVVVGDGRCVAMSEYAPSIWKRDRGDD